jgi:PiT family inorganic phosphate transporter
MPDPSLWLLILVIALAIGFGIANGFNDAANAIATAVGTRVLSPRNAIILAAFLNMAGAITGTAVAKTIGKGILTETIILEYQYLPLIAALASIVFWASLATHLGLPVSISHGFVASLAGAGIAIAGFDAVVWSVMQRIIAAVAITPALGFIGGFTLMISILWICRHSAPARMQSVFRPLQILATAFMAYSHGKNDGQMPIGVITMALVIYHSDPTLWDRLSILDSSTRWVIIISAAAISLGTATGGWKVIRTLGLRVTALQPVHGFAAQAAAATVIEGASQLGIPVSTTHCITSAIMGVGATKRLSAVRWGIARNIVIAWIATFPICGGVGYLFVRLAQLVP